MKYCTLASCLLGLLSYRSVLGETTSNEEDTLLTRHDYKLSFKKPYLIGDTIPYFSFHDNAIASPNSIRLAPSVPGLKGSIWAEKSNPYKEWEVEFSFTITGRGYTGGNGIAFWYTKERAKSGPIYGNRDQWDGLAIFFDTFDPKANRYSPFISAVLNDGELKISQVPEKNSKMFAGCPRDYRNAKGPVYAKLSYYDNTLNLSIDTSEKGKAYTKCFEAPNIALPTGYYFGFSASTSELADDHDIISFETYEVNPPGRKKATSKRPHEEEKVKKEGSFKLKQKDKKKIEEIQSKMEKLRKKEELEETGLPPLLDGLHETQYKIMEALESLHSTVEELVKEKEDAPIAMISQDGSPVKVDAELGQKVSKMAKDISGLKKTVTTLADDIQEFMKTVKENEELQKVRDSIDLLDSKIENIMSKVGSKGFKSTKNQMGNSTQPPVERSYWKYILGFVCLQVALAVGYTVYSKKFDDSGKKYI
ncbi:hypothetical protein K7432_000068 [Basidiobolus ranarum]|uniref:L-type lectin-like domain-containing protein n=1 Tax=Basidiobolus ranarum TaxID=34480 RepID=A0ABR2WBR7_9FUNG